MPATIVTFPQGAIRGEGTVTHAQSDPDGAIIVVDSTPFHPVDHTWPDQPGDSGSLRAGDHAAGLAVDQEVEVCEAVMAAVSDDGVLAVGSDIPVKRGGEGWTWLVGHRIAPSALPTWAQAGAEVSLKVDAERRAALSRGHTACHLASLALDAALAELWRKDPGVDALGAPDFEGRANQSSRIHEDGSVDEYRLGKSLRKAGFDTETFGATLADREKRINELLEAWVKTGARSWITAEGPAIVDRRSWHCELPDGEAVFLCGGTHVDTLAAFASIAVSLNLSDPQLLVMTTTAIPVV